MRGGQGGLAWQMYSTAKVRKHDPGGAGSIDFVSCSTGTSPTNAKPIECAMGGKAEGLITPLQGFPQKCRFSP